MRQTGLPAPVTTKSSSVRPRSDRSSVEARTLLGVLQESRGQHHAAYQSYKTALMANPQFGPALDNLRRYCERYGLDFHNKAINPAAE